MKTDKQIIIAGGGLSGLTLAYLLLQQGIKAVILEASPGIGGRIQTIKGALGTPLELGATWFSDSHPNLLSLIKELELEAFPQYSKGISLFQTKSFEPPQKFFVPESEAPSYRVAGGTTRLIEALAQKLDTSQIQLNKKVTAVKELEDGLIIQTADGDEYIAGICIFCIPPQLVASQINVQPGLPESIYNILPSVQTWMAGSVKFAVEYTRPFWRENGFSGMLYSHAGMIVEMYDHTNFEENRFAIAGFLNPGSASYTPDVRKEFVLQQLGDLLGYEALQPAAYFDKVWKDEFISDGIPVIQRPHQNNGHPLLQETYLNGKLFFCNTETSGEFAGYMEGAIIAVRSLAGKFK